MNEPISELGRFSPLYERFNGIMLGFFSQMSACRAVRTQWPALRNQMVDFVSEINLRAEIPDDADDFQNRRGELSHAVFGLGEHLTTFKLAFGIGYSLAGLALNVEIMPRSGLELGMSALRVDPAFLDRCISTVSHDAYGRPVFDDLMTAGLKLTTEVVANCAREADTCFVAMPFCEPFASYYPEVYRALLESQGLRCVRAWGGMSNETHNDMLLTLIDRCGWLFAELTDSNPNVAYELGFATGCKRFTLAVMDTNPAAWKNWRVPGHPKLISNLRGLAVMPYDSSTPEWREDFVNNLGPQYVRVAMEIYGKQQTDLSGSNDRRIRRGIWSRLFNRGTKRPDA